MYPSNSNSFKHAIISSLFKVPVREVIRVVKVIALFS